jgi:hypothetical protein
MTTLEREFELGQEGEGSKLIHRTAQFTIRLNLLNNRFRATDGFLDDWIKLSAAGRIGTTFQFRKRFCEANHYEVDMVLGGKPRTVQVFEAWGYPMVYFAGANPKPLLVRIMPKGWHLTLPGRIVGPPQFCNSRP